MGDIRGCERLTFPLGDERDMRLFVDIAQGNPIALASLYLRLGRYVPRGGAGTDFWAHCVFVAERKGWDEAVVFVAFRPRARQEADRG